MLGKALNILTDGKSQGEEFKKHKAQLEDKDRSICDCIYR